MLRKLVNIFILVLFVVSTTGFSISKHYCKGELISVALNTNPTPCCDINSCGCCHEESQFFQVEEDFTVSQYSNIQQSFSLELISNSLDNDRIIESTNELDFTVSTNGPPFKDRQFLYYIHQLKLAPPIC